MEDGCFTNTNQYFHGEIDSSSYLMEDDLLTFETDQTGYADTQIDNRVSISNDESLNQRSEIKVPSNSLQCHADGRSNRKPDDLATAILHTSLFPSLTQVSDNKIQSKMENWDQDVLLSNAGLPEINPLLDLVDDSVDDDFQRMLSDWENHINTLQHTNESTNNFGSNILNPLEDYQGCTSKVNTTSYSSVATVTDNRGCKQPEVSYSNSSSVLEKSEFAGERNGSNNLNETAYPEKHGPWNVNNTITNNDNSTPMAPFSPLSKVMAIASTAPMSPITDDYFDSESASPLASESSREKEFDKSMPTLYQPTKSSTNTVGDCNEEGSSKYNGKVSETDESSGESRLSNHVDNRVGNNLAGIVISSGPGGHFEAFEVLEASDPENLLERFEDASQAAQAVGQNNQDPNEMSSITNRATGPLTFSKSSQDPHKKSQIIAAVQNHFSISSPSETNQLNIDSKSAGKRPPLIVPSQRIKDALPKEIIEKIKASSQRSRTISIIEPASNSSTQANYNGITNKNMVKVNGQTNGILKGQSECSGKNFIGKDYSNDKTFRQIPYKNTKVGSNLNPSVWTTRFQDAATNLNRNRQYRHFGNTPSPPSSITIDAKKATNMQPTSVVLPNQHPPNQVSLDHDYCSPGNKVRRQKIVSSGAAANNHHLRLVGCNSNSKTYTYLSEASTGNKIEVVRSVNNTPLHANSLHTSPQIIRKRATLMTASAPSQDEINNATSLASTSSTNPITSSGSTIPISIPSRPYVRVSTGHKVVTANLLKPTPLTMRKNKEHEVSGTSTKTLNGANTEAYNNKSYRSLHIRNKLSRSASGSSPGSVNQQIPNISLTIPQNSPSTTGGVSLVDSSIRRDSDHKKDSGLESGEVSEDSQDGRISGHSDETDGYSKLPPYLTTVNVNNCSDSRSVSAIDESGCYDRLPAYITGVGSRANSVERIGMGSLGEHNNSALTTMNNHEYIPDGSRAHIVEGSNPISSTKVKKANKPYRRQNNKSESSRSRSRSPIEIKRRVRGSPKSKTMPEGTRKGSAATRSQPRSRSRSSSSSSSYLSSRCSSPESSSSAPTPIKEEKNRSKKRSWKKVSRKRSISSSRPSRSRLSSSSRGRNGDRGASSPKRTRRASRGVKDEYEHGFNRRFTRDRQRREQEERHNDQEGSRKVEERRVVFAGKIAEGTTRADLRKRFEVFGPIVEISVHFRDRGDNYGFVTFKYKVDAYEAIEHGNDDPSFPNVDISFGGRRTFCKEKYSDLDSAGPELDLSPRFNPRHFSPDVDTGSKIKTTSSANGKRAPSSDFDDLLQQARAGISMQQPTAERNRRLQK